MCVMDIMNKKKKKLSKGLWLSGRPQDGNERKRNDWQILGFYLKIKKAVEYDDHGDCNYCWYPKSSGQELEKGVHLRGWDA